MALCRGSHVERPDELGAFKVLWCAGACRRGDQRNAQLQRGYGTVEETVSPALAKDG